MIPTPEYLGLYYPSKDLTTPGADPPDRVVGVGSTQLKIATSSMAEPSGYWDGAVGFFCGESTAALRGITFHARRWDAENGILQVAGALPVAPVAGDTFRLFVGGKTASSQMVLSMKVAGKQPELDGVSSVNLPGVTIRKASAMLGEGTLEVRTVFSNGNRIVSLRMNGGDYGPGIVLEQDVNALAVYNKDYAGFILVDIAYDQISTVAARTATFTLATPKGNLIPNFEGYETNDGLGRTRYHLVVAKNNAPDSLDAMSAFSIWSGKPNGTQTTLNGNCNASYVTPLMINVYNAPDWPVRGFWIRNKTRNDLRYVDYRSGNSLYTKAVVWSVMTFDQGRLEIRRGTTIGNNAQNPSTTAVVDQVVLESGSWSDGNAAGTLYLKKYYGANKFGTTNNFYVGSEWVGVANSLSTRGFRDKNAVAWNNGDLIEPTSDLDLAINLPTGGYYKNPDNENVAPDDFVFGLYPSQEESLIVESILGQEEVGIWLRQTILDGTQARENIEDDLNFCWY